MTGVNLSYSEGTDGSREYRLSISREALESVDLDMRSHKLLDVNDDDLLISDKLWKLGNVVRRIERQPKKTNKPKKRSSRDTVKHNVFDEHRNSDLD